MTFIIEVFDSLQNNKKNGEKEKKNPIVITRLKIKLNSINKSKYWY